MRVETTLKQDATIPGITDTMSAYKMKLLSGSRTTELQGTDGTTYASAARNVFAINARLKIEKIATAAVAVGSGGERSKPLEPVKVKKVTIVRPAAK